MEKLEFRTVIASSRQKAWETMLNPKTYKEWVGAAWPGSTYQGEWKEGEDIRFVGDDSSGTLAHLVEYRPYDYILAEHVAVLKQGVEDRDSDEAKGWIGTMESYKFTEQNGQTELTVIIETNPEWASMFSDGWPKALAKLKEICERTN
jgi:uncharacterized protein YndB with AHSA1/START domain